MYGATVSESSCGLMAFIKVSTLGVHAHTHTRTHARTHISRGQTFHIAIGFFKKAVRCNAKLKC